MTTRRTLLAALAILPLAGTAALAQATPIGAIRVDVSRLVEQGWGANAQGIAQTLQHRLSELLAPQIRRGAGTTLVVTVRGVWLASWAGGGGGGKPSGGGASNDNFDSVATIVDRSGRVIASYPILSVVDSGSGGAWYRPDVDQRRVAALIENNALWIKKYVGG